VQNQKKAQEPAAIQIDEIPRVSLVDDIVERLMEYIVEQQLRPGDKLPSERLLTKALGVSRFPLREALAQLQILGIISVAHGKGAFVSKLSAPKLLRRLSPVLRSQAGVTSLDMIEVRLALECQVAALAASRRSSETIERLEKDLTGMEREIHDRDRFIEHDIDFHETIAEATDNPIFVALVAILHDLIHTVQERFPDSLDARQSSLKYHQEILQALKEKDVDGSAEIMQAHLEDIAGRLREEAKSVEGEI